MSLEDKIKNTVEETGGKVKQAVGDLTDNKDLKSEGQADKTSGGLKNAGESVKDAAGKAKDAVS